MESNYWTSRTARRISRRRLLAVTGATASAAAFLAACGGGDGGDDDADQTGLLTKPADETKGAKKGGVWLGSHNADIQTFDPHFQSVPNQALTQFTYSRLFRAKPGHLQKAVWGEVEGDLARSWEFSPDRLTLTIKLQDTKWHMLPPLNGRQLTADDVAFSFQRLEKVGTNRTLFANSVSPNAPIESVTAPDKGTVVLKLKFPAAALLTTLATFTAGSFYVVPVEAEGGFDIARTQIGSGPFMLAEYAPSARYVYRRNEGYYDVDRTYVDEVQLPIVTEYSTALAQFRAGSIYRYGAGGTGITGEDIIPLKQSLPALELHQGDIVQQTYSAFYGWNPARGEKTPFRDRRLRQAFTLSWDRDLFIDAVYNVAAFAQQGIDLETRWNTPVYNVSDGWWLDPKGRDFGANAKYYQFDLDEAKKLMGAAGYPGGLDIDAQYVTTAQYGPNFVNQVEIILSFAREAGLRMVTKPVGFTTDWRPKVADTQGDFDGISFRIFPEGSADWGDRLFSVYHPEGGLNYTGLFNTDTSTYKKGDPKLTEIIEKVRVEFDTKKRADLIKDFQRLDAPEMYRPRFPGSAAALSVIWPVVRNHRVWVGSDIDYVGMWLDPTKAPLSG